MVQPVSARKVFNMISTAIHSIFYFTSHFAVKMHCFADHLYQDRGGGGRLYPEIL